MCWGLLFLAEAGKRKEEGEIEGEGRALSLGGRNENHADPTSASAHLLARKGCNGRRWTQDRGKK